MNKDMRKELDKAIDFLAQAKAIIENIRDQEQETYDDMSEKAQEGEKGEKMQAAIGSLEEATEAVDTTVEAIESAKEG